MSYIVHCMSYIIHSMPYIVCRTLYIIYRTMYKSVHCTIYNVHTMYTIWHVVNDNLQSLTIFKDRKGRMQLSKDIMDI